MIEYRARPASDEHYELAEGPYWDAPRERLLWVDILRGLVLEGTVAGDRVQVSREHRFDGMVGAVVVADDGSLWSRVRNAWWSSNPTAREDPDRGSSPRA